MVGTALGGYTAGQNYTISLLNDSIKCLMTTASYTPDQNADQFKSSITNEVSGTGYTAGGQALSSRTLAYSNTGHTTTFDAADVNWTSSTIANARYAVLYKDTGTSSTSPLIAYIDFGSNQSSNNGDFIIQWNASGIIQLTVS